MEEGSLEKQPTQGYLPCRPLKLGEMNPTLSVHSTEEQSGRKSWWLLRAAVICYPSSALNLSLWLSKRQCQAIFPLSGQAGETEALALPLLFEGWNIQSQFNSYQVRK